MTTTFKPGDRVRRTSSFHAHREQDSVYRGEEFTVSRIESRNHGVILEGKDSSFSYSPGAFELVAAADRKIQVGDKVRVQYDAVVIEVEDSWDGVRVETSNPRLHWDTFGPNGADKFLTVIEPAPAPEPKPDPKAEARAVWDAMGIGDTFHFGDTSAKSERTKVSATHFTYSAGSVKLSIEPFFAFSIEPFFVYGIVVHPKPTRREQVNALPDGTRFSCPGPYAPLGHYIKLEEDVVWARTTRAQWSIKPGAEHYAERWNEPGEIKLDED